MGEKILLIEDNRIIANNLFKLLLKDNFIVKKSNNLEQVNEILNTEKFDFVICKDNANINPDKIKTNIPIIVINDKNNKKNKNNIFYEKLEEIQPISEMFIKNHDDKSIEKLNNCNIANSEFRTIKNAIKNYNLQFFRKLKIINENSRERI